MRRLFSHVLAIATAVLSAFSGCSCRGTSNGPPEERPKRQIRWRGPDTGYEATTTIPPEGKTEHCQ